MKKKDIVEKTAKEAGISKDKAEKLVNGVTGLVLHELYNFKGKISTKYSKPHFSIERLAEYMISSPSKRAAIVKNQKENRGLFIEYHKESRRIISSFISEVIKEEKYWEEYHRVKNKKIHTDISQEKQDICLSSLEEFEKIMYDVEFPKYKKKYGERNQKKGSLHRIKLEVNPDILLYNSKGLVTGAIKLIFDINKNKERIKNEYLSTILLQYMRIVYGVNIKNTDCYIIDIYNSTIETSPAGYKKIMVDIKAACDEIKDTWKRV